MSAGPPGILERMVGLLLPPACREEVLGDLREKRKGSLQYLGLAISVVPFVIWSRIRRTCDALLLLMEGMLVYASYLAAAWYADSALLSRQGELSQLAVPAALFAAFMTMEDAWSPVGQKSAMKHVRNVAMGSLFVFVCMAWRLPETLNLMGASASLLLVSSVRLLFRTGATLPQGAGAGFWMKQIATPPLASGNVKWAIGAVIALYFVAVILMASHVKAGVTGGMAAVVVILAARLMSGKE